MSLSSVLIGISPGLHANLRPALLEEVGDVVSISRWSPEAVTSDLALVILESNSALSVTVDIRRSTAAPLLVLTPAAPELRAACMDAGADACMAADEDPRLVLAQARALLRRQEVPPEIRAEMAPLTAGRLRIDPESRRVSGNGNEIALAPREFDLLAFLAQHPGRVFRRHELLSAIWGPRYVGDSNTVDVHVAWLRNKLPGDCGARITTLRGVGYRFDLL